jgi:hypothetical protein
VGRFVMRKIKMNRAEAAQMISLPEDIQAIS